MQKAIEKDQSYPVYNFEMESLENVYSNLALRSDVDFAGYLTHTANVRKCASRDFVPLGDTSFGHTAVTPRREIFFGSAGWGKEGKAIPNAGNHSQDFYFDQYALVADQYGNAMPPSRKRGKTEKPDCSANQLKNTGFYANLTGSREERQQEKKSSKEERKSTPSRFNVSKHQNVGRRYCCGIVGIREIALLQVLTFFTAVAGLTLVMMILNGMITVSPNTVNDAASPEKQADFSSRFQELESKFSKIKEELDNTRQQLKELGHVRNPLPEWKTLNDTIEANFSRHQEDFKMMLNSSEKRLMTMISDIEVQVNKTDQKLREETRSLWATGNASTDKIHKIKSSLNDLRDKVHSGEQRINQTIDLKIKDYGDVKPLQMSFNKTLREMKNELTRIWFSLNSTGERLQEQITASSLSMWSAVNATQLELVNKITNVSKMAGPSVAQGLNGKGYFSQCKYDVEIGFTTTGHDTVADASVAESIGSRIIGVTCSTNFAQEYNLVSTVSSNKQKYICNCKGASNLFHPTSTSPKKTCKLHYWSCPIG
ncbi:uncharacterized protein [Montipora foliosa]|uniref:uncharacterized protein isoform X1 n=2 Tax=Montipora foliosa TaxID=591990 RepID=UPI0035F1ECBC